MILNVKFFFFLDTTTIHQQLDQTNTSKNSMYRSSERYLPRDSTGNSTFYFVFTNTVGNLNFNFNILICEGLDNEIAKKYIFEACNQQKPISFESWLTPKFVLYGLLLCFHLFIYFFILGVQKSGKK